MEHGTRMLLVISLSSLLFFSAESIDEFLSPVPSPAQSPEPAAASLPIILSPAASAPMVDSNIDNADPLLQHLCDTTDNPLLCFSSVAPLLAGDIDPIAVLEKEIEVSNKEVQLAIAEIDKVSENRFLAEYTLTCLLACKEAYERAIEDLTDALTAISAHDVGGVYAELSAFVSNVYDCSAAFEEAGPDVENPVEETFDKLCKLGGNNLAIAQAIKI